MTVCTGGRFLNRRAREKKKFPRLIATVPTDIPSYINTCLEGSPTPWSVLQELCLQHTLYLKHADGTRAADKTRAVCNSTGQNILAMAPPIQQTRENNGDLMHEVKTRPAAVAPMLPSFQQLLVHLKEPVQ